MNAPETTRTATPVAPHAMPPTVLDVARRAGVSTATVSRVLGHSPRASETSRARVLAAIQELGFRPNSAARALRLGRSNTVALLVGDIEQNVYAGLTKHFEAMLGQIGLDLLLYDLGHSEARLEGIVERALALRLRGVAIASSDRLPVPLLTRLAHGLRERGVAVLSVRQRLIAYGIPSIVQDDRAATRVAVRHLLAAGRRAIAYVGRIAGSTLGTERYRGYRDALAEIGLPYRPELVVDASYRYRAGYEALVRMLRAGTRPDAVQAGSDEIALGALAAIFDQGLAVPDDIAVIGFGNVDWSAHVRPALTTISEDAEQLARKAQDFFSLSAEGGPPSPLVVIRRRLVLRRSA
ncbi:MAG: LacI family DNA-binding transcriptional regulator [Acetobacteraceae bacterium]